MSSTPNFDFCRVFRLDSRMDVVFLVEPTGKEFGITVVYPSDTGALAYHRLDGAHSSRTEALLAVENNPLELLNQIP